MSENNKKSLQITILSLSFVTVMAGAAVSPALGQIKAFYSDASPVLIQMVSSLPAIFIVVTNLLFSKVSKHFDSKTLAIAGLLIYVVGGASGGLSNTVYLLLCSRALMGVGVGLIMPLSTGLLAYYFSPEQQGTMMGYSSAMNNIGGIVAMTLSGILSSMNWRYSFLVYLIGLLVILLVVIFLPKAKIGNTKADGINIKDIQIRKFIYFGMFLTQVIFYIFITNFSVISKVEGLIPPSQIGLVMSMQAIGAFILAMFFGRLNRAIGHNIKYIGIIVFALSYIILAIERSFFLILIALFLNGIAFGILVPYFNTVAIKKVEKGKSTGIMSIMSASQFLGQFSSPLILTLIISLIGAEALKIPYTIGAFLCILLLIVLMKIKDVEESK